MVKYKENLIWALPDTIGGRRSEKKAREHTMGGRERSCAYYLSNYLDRLKRYWQCRSTLQTYFIYVYGIWIYGDSVGKGSGGWGGGERRARELFDTIVGGFAQKLWLVQRYGRKEEEKRKREKYKISIEESRACWCAKKSTSISSVRHITHGAIIDPLAIYPQYATYMETPSHRREKKKKENLT